MSYKCESMQAALPPGCLQYFRSPSAVVRSFNYGPPVESKVRYLSGLRYSICLRVEENFCSIKWETETNSSFSWGQPTYEENVVACRDDFITVDQGSTYGMGPGEDRFCGTRLHEKNVLISHSKPFMLRVKSNMDAVMNSQENQNGFSLRYTQLPCVD
ncbi:hypothetical protein HPB47_004912 [Ixodes persulcatus]|uniref:Uncharacterized protein n=1 Tax=Ixodes persulcatus TaxID=34615 RepID=A0AC60PF86_IXOPE|nr:hypothetical protein HPB47_004912 [Ixodes persulcatus]